MHLPRGWLSPPLLASTAKSLCWRLGCLSGSRRPFWWKSLYQCKKSGETVVGRWYRKYNYNHPIYLTRYQIYIYILPCDLGCEKKKRCLPPLIIASPFEGLGSQWPWNKKSVSQGPNLAPFLLAKSNWVWFLFSSCFPFRFPKPPSEKSISKVGDCLQTGTPQVAGVLNSHLFTTTKTEIWAT